MAHVKRRKTTTYLNPNKDRRKWHKDWRIWAVVLLMLGAMAMYILSLDNSFVPRFLGK